MKVKGKYQYEYLALNLKSSVVKRFRKFSKKISKSQSETLTALMDFFYWHGVSPYDRFGPQLNNEIEKNRKRINAAIAIIKSVEKSQNVPLVNIETMLLSLFEADTKNKEPILVEKKFLEKTPKEIEEEKTMVPITRYERLELKYKDKKELLKYLLNKITPVSTTFGKNYFKIEIAPEELARYKQGLKNE